MLWIPYFLEEVDCSDPILLFVTDVTVAVYILGLLQTFPNSYVYTVPSLQFAWMWGSVWVLLTVVSCSPLSPCSHSGGSCPRERGGRWASVHITISVMSLYHISLIKCYYLFEVADQYRHSSRAAVIWGQLLLGAHVYSKQVLLSLLVTCSLSSQQATLKMAVLWWIPFSVVLILMYWLIHTECKSAWCKSGTCRTAVFDQWSMVIEVVYG